MRQMFVFPFATGIILTAVSVALAAPVQGAPDGTNTGKSIYSSKPKSVSTNSTFAAQQPQAVMQQHRQFVVQNDGFAADEQVVPSNVPSSRRAPMPPAIPQRSESFADMPFVVSDDLPFEGNVSSERIVGETVISDRPLHESRPLQESSSDRPLSGIDIPSRTPIETVVPVPTKSPWTSAQAQMNRPLNASPVSPTNETKNTDEFNARLAKIQLEKKNLDETLNLIEKIQSPTFKVKTLVDLAEYVSRDNNYKKEADRLYDLAVAGINSLASGKPVVVSTLKQSQPAPAIAPKTETSLAPTQSPKPTPKKPLSLVDDDEPVAVAPKSVKPAEPKLPAPSVPKLELKEESKESLPKLVEAIKIPEKENKKPSEQSDKTSETKPIIELPKPSVPKRPTLSLLDDEDESTPKPSLTAEKPEKQEPTLAPPKSSRPRLSLIDEPEDDNKAGADKKQEGKDEKEIGELPTLPAIPKKPEPEKIMKDELSLPSLKKEETKSGDKANPMVETQKPSRRSLFKLDDKEEKAESTTNPNEAIDSADKKTKDIELESPQPKRRPMPRKKIILED